MSYMEYKIWLQKARDSDHKRGNQNENTCFKHSSEEWDKEKQGYRFGLKSGNGVADR